MTGWEKQKELAQYRVQPAQEQATQVLDQADRFVRTVTAHLAAAGKM